MIPAAFDYKAPTTVEEALSAIARRRRDERDGTRWDASQPLLSGRSGAIPQGHLGYGTGHDHAGAHHHTGLAHDAGQPHDDGGES